MKLTDIEITDSEISKKINEIRQLHLNKKDEEAVGVLDDYVQKYNLFAIEPFNEFLFL